MLAADPRPRMQTKRDPTPSVRALPRSMDGCSDVVLGEESTDVAATSTWELHVRQWDVVRSRADSSSRRAEVRPHRAGASGRRRPDSIHRLAETISRAAADGCRRAKGWPRRS